MSSSLRRCSCSWDRSFCHRLPCTAATSWNSLHACRVSSSNLQLWWKVCVYLACLFLNKVFRMVWQFFSLPAQQRKLPQNMRVWQEKKEGTATRFLLSTYHVIITLNLPQQEASYNEYSLLQSCPWSSHKAMSEVYCSFPARPCGFLWDSIMMHIKNITGGARLRMCLGFSVCATKALVCVAEKMTLPCSDWTDSECDLPDNLSCPELWISEVWHC